MKPALWVVGGLCVGTAFLLMLPSWTSSGGIGVANMDGAYAGPASQVFSETGYDTISNLSVFGQGWLALIVGLTGFALLVYVNATAWKETGGY